MPFEFEKQIIPEVILIKPKTFEDDRGFFLESYKYSDFSKNGIFEKFVQDNYSKSSKGVLRGLHFQKEPKAQAKIVRCVRGKILDVAVDIRRNSPTYGKYVSAVLSSTNKHMFYIPVGFAHGFLTLENDTHIEYKCSEEYSPENDSGIIWNDKSININWGIENPIISKKDANLPTLEKMERKF